MKRDDNIPSFNELSEAEQVQEMGKSAPRQVAQLVPTKTDADFAKEIRDKLIEVIQPVLQTIDLADSKGFEVTMGFGKGPLGKQVISVLRVMKEYK